MGEIEENQTVERDDDTDKRVWIGRENGEKKIGSGEEFHSSSQKQLGNRGLFRAFSGISVYIHEEEIDGSDFGGFSGVIWVEKTKARRRGKSIERREEKERILKQSLAGFGAFGCCE